MRDAGAPFGVVEAPTWVGVEGGPAPAGHDVHILICNWRDTRNPEGGGSELYVEQMARGLVERGHHVTIACAKHPAAADDDVVDGVRYVRRGTKLDIYLVTVLRLLLRRYGRVDLVVDVQNGLPFFTRLGTRRPVVVLVHHVHREQWPVVYPGVVGRLGWWIESRLSPRLYRRSRYVTVSEASRRELVELGVDDDRITVVHNGTAAPPPTRASRSELARLCVLGRLVPHKQVEHAVDALGALRTSHPGATLDVVGDGWWSEELHDYVARRGLTDAVTFHGHVDDVRKHELLAQAWVMLLPSLKEGWGLVVGEAGAHGTPTIAYRSAGGTTESIDHKDSGLLVEDHDEFVAATCEVVRDAQWRTFLGEGARAKSATFTWPGAQQRFADVLGR